MKTDAELHALAERALAQHRAREGAGTLYRDMDLEIEEAVRATPPDPNAEASRDDGRPIDIALSSETAVERYDFWTDTRYNEVLEHTADAIDMSRAGAGMPFLADHDSSDWTSHMGTIRDVRLDPTTKKLRGRVTFSRRPDAQALRADMLDGIRTKISVGYRVDPTRVAVTRGKDGAHDTHRFQRWTPLEGSSVAIPADEAVGVGRALDGLGPHELTKLRTIIATMQQTPTPAPKAEERAVPEPTAAATAAEAPPPVDLKVVRAEVRDQTKRVIEILKEHKLETRMAEAIEKEIDVPTALAMVREMYSNNLAQSVASPAAVSLTPSEQKRYNLARGTGTFINAADKKGDTSSFETEISDTLRKNLPPGQKDGGGLWVPMCANTDTARLHNAANERGLFLRNQFGAPQTAYDPRQRTGLATTSGSIGGDLVFTVPGEFLEILRNFMAVYAAGASYMTGLQGPIAFPQQLAAGTASWVAENPGSDVSDSNMTFDQVTLSPKTTQSSTSYSRQLWVQSVIDVDGLVKQDLAAITALLLDLAAIAGTGSSNQPTGITAWSGTSSYAMGTNGGTPGYVDLVGMESLITAANADQWPLSYMVHPTTRGTFKKAVPLSSTNGLPVWTNSAEMGVGVGLQSGGTSRKVGELNGYPAWATAQIPNALTKGSSSGDCLAGIFGAFSQLVIGDWGMFEIIVDPYRLKKQGMIELTTFAMYGIAIKYPAAFAVCKDFLA
jgi:HK97 family phage major capsid protein